MPLVHVYYREGLLHQEEVKEVSACIHHALIEHFNIPENDYFHMYFPCPSHSFFYDPYYLLQDGAKRTDNMMHVSITCGPGRTVTQKKKLYEAISEACRRHVHISAADVFITLIETPAENWSFGQGRAQLVEEEKKL